MQVNKICLFPSPTPPQKRTYECSICYQRSCLVVRCKGPCNNLICHNCYQRSIKNDDRCPYRCSSLFFVKPPDLDSLQCPFAPVFCRIAINHKKDLASHHFFCHFISRHERKQISQKQNYQCKRDHRLSFLPNIDINHCIDIEKWDNSCFQCVICNKYQIKQNRSFCAKCSQYEYDFYCIDCRMPPFSQIECPIGHQFIFKKLKGKKMFCNICKGSISEERNTKYCSYCDIFICQPCFYNLPGRNSLKPMNHISNKQTCSFVQRNYSNPRCSNK